MRNHLKMLSAAVALALANAAAYAYTPVRHDGTYTTNGVTYAQRGGLGSADYVVTNIDASAVGRVRSVNGMVGDVVIDAEGVGAVARDADYLAVSNAAMGAVQKEVDPSVPSWAKGETPPLPPDYAAVASNAAVAVKTETDPTVPAWAKAATKPTYTTSEISGLTASLNSKLDKTGGTITGSVQFNAGWTAMGDESDTISVGQDAGDGYVRIGETKYRRTGIFTHNANLYFPDDSGTIALTNDIPTTMPWGSITGKPDIPTMGAISNVADSAAGLAYTNANAYTDASISETNDAFVAAVQAASPPVVLPQKWALANVTNAQGGAVTAADVGAVKRYEDHSDWSVDVLSSTNMTYDFYGNEGQSYPSFMTAYVSAEYPAFRYDGVYGTKYITFDRLPNPQFAQMTQLMFGIIANGFGVYYEDGYGGVSSVSLPYNANGYFAIESWDSLSRTLNNTATNATCKAACADVLEKISESKPHFAIIDGEVHIISITP